MRGSPAHHVWQIPRILVLFQCESETPHTQSAVITLEILRVTMEAFVSFINGLDEGHSFTDCAESIFRLFNFISCSGGDFWHSAKRN